MTDVSMLNYLEFERPIAELEARIDELCGTTDEADANVSVVEQLRTSVAS